MGGSLFCWGHNTDAQLGVGDYLDRDLPTPVMRTGPWTLVDSGT